MRLSKYRQVPQHVAYLLPAASLLSVATAIIVIILFTAIIFILFTAIIFTASLANAQGPTSGNPTPLDDNFSGDYEEQVLYFTEDENRGLLTFDVEFAGEIWTIALNRVSVRSDEFQLLIDDGNQPRVATPPAIATWRGTVAQAPGREVRATIREDSDLGTLLTAIIYPAEAVELSDAIVIQPLSTLEESSVRTPTTPPMIPGSGGPIDPPGTPNTTRNLHAVYRASDILPETEGVCANRDRATMMAALGGMFVREGLNLCELAVDADYDFYAAHDFDVDDTVQTIEEIINCVIPIYEVTDLAITYELTAIVVRVTDDDPYDDTDPVELINTMSEVWGSEPENAIDFDAVHLFTDADLYGGIVGLAGTGTICDDEPFGLSKSMYTTLPAVRVALTAHELGHGWNASHCSGGDCKIMCPSIAGCGAYDSFAQDAVEDIADFRDASGCLTTLLGPIVPPFVDSFDEPEIDSGRWIYVNGADISSDAVGEPSGDYALRLGAESDGQYADDEIRSNQILLGSVTGAVLSYSIEHRGTEGSETLYVDYLNVMLEWTELESYEADGTDQSTFSTQTVILPDDAYHEQFRLRLRADVDDTDDFWYVDDIELREVPDVPAEATEIVPEVGPIAGGNALTLTGEGFLPDAIVTVGGYELTDLEFVSETQLVGIVPEASMGGTVDVIISQFNGETLLQGAYTYSDNYLDHERAEALIGEEMWLSILGNHVIDLDAYSFTIETDPDLVTTTDVTVAGTQAQEADFIEIEINNGVIDGYWSVSVVMDTTFPFEMEIPTAEDATVLAFAHYRVSDRAMAGDKIRLPFTDGREVPLTYVGRAITITPAADPGQILVTGAAPPTFIRGDANRNNSVELLDAIEILDYLFRNSPLVCADAADASDNGTISLIDSMIVLSYLFNSGADPKAPFPDADVDPTADDLTCDM